MPLHPTHLPGVLVCQQFGREYVDEFQRRHATIKCLVKIPTPPAPLTFLSDVLWCAYGWIQELGDQLSVDAPYLRCSSREVRELGHTNSEFEVILTFDMTPYNNWGVSMTTQGQDVVLERTLYPSVGVGIPARFNASPAKYLNSLPSGAADEFVLNRAKDPFDPPTTTQRRQTVITLTNLVHNIGDIGNPPFTSVGQMLSYVGKVNKERRTIFSLPDDTLAMGCDYWTLMFDDINVQKLLRPDGGCDLAVNVRIIYDPLGHCAVVLNAGYTEMVNNKAQQIKGDDGQLVSAPVCLDKDGKKIPKASLPGAATYIVFPDHDACEFDDWNFPKHFCGATPTLAP